MEVNILGYKFSEKELAEETRSVLVVEKELPRKIADVTTYWQNYEEASLNKPPFWYMLHDKSLDGALGEPAKFTVTIPEESFFNSFGEAISAYSLRNLTSNPEQFVVRVSTGFGPEPAEYDLTESQINLKYLLGLGLDLQVIKWYDQAGTDQSLIATDVKTAPYILSKGEMFFEGLRPAIHFENGNQLQLIAVLKPVKDNIRIYNVSSYSDKQVAGVEGNSLLYNANNFITFPIISWLPDNILKMLSRNPITQNGVAFEPEEDRFGPFKSPLSNLNLYQIKNALNSPINFGFGNAVNMNMCEFILYPDENTNITSITKNITDFYKII